MTNVSVYLEIASIFTVAFAITAGVLALLTVQQLRKAVRHLQRAVAELQSARADQAAAAEPRPGKPAWWPAHDVWSCLDARCPEHHGGPGAGR